MQKLNTIIVIYQGHNYQVIEIPDVITNEDRTIFIGPHSLHLALYNEEIGYTNETARKIDEQIYAYLDDNLFSLNYNDFIRNVKEYLD